MVRLPETSGAAATSGALRPPVNTGNEEAPSNLRWTITSSLPLSHTASAGWSLVKATTANGSGLATSDREGHSAASTDARMLWSL